TPPALFPVCLGMIGVGLGWRLAVEIGAPMWISDLWLIIACGYFGFAYLCYLAKVSVKPEVVFDDLAAGPGKAAVSAGSMCLMLLAAAIAPLSVPIATGVWFAGLTVHFLSMLIVIARLVRDGKDKLQITPPMFLPFVGFIVAPIAGARLGLEVLSHYIFWAMLAPYAIIFALALQGMLRNPTPPPARSGAMIFLAPTAIFAVGAWSLEMYSIFEGFLILSLIVAVVLALKTRWLTTGGWTPLWGAFTFPLAAFSNACVLAAIGYGGTAIYAAWAMLVFSSIVVMWLFLLTARAWAQGKLAPATAARTV
ncbi:MAG: hypothetical protein ACPGGK_15140, partial [Pikeienuella sp.]